MGHDGCCLDRSGLLDDTEQIPVRILQHDEVRRRTISPRIARRAKRDQPLHFACLVAGIEIKMQPAPPAPTLLPCLERKVRPSLLGIPKNHPSTLGRSARNIAQGGLPKRNHAIELVTMDDDRTNAHRERPQLTAFFTSVLILASSVAVNSFSAKAAGHMAPSSRFALSLKPNVAYLDLNFCALWKKQTTLSSLAYAGIPYHSLGERAGALVLMIAWRRLAMARSGSAISAIFASTSLSPSARSARAPRCAAALSSWMRSFIATRSSSVNPLNFLPIAVVRLADFCVPFFGLIETSSY